MTPAQNRELNRSLTRVGTFEVFVPAYVTSGVLAAILKATKTSGGNRANYGEMCMC